MVWGRLKVVQGGLCVRIGVCRVMHRWCPLQGVDSLYPQSHDLCWQRDHFSGTQPTTIMPPTAKRPTVWGLIALSRNQMIGAMLGFREGWVGVMRKWGGAIGISSRCMVHSWLQRWKIVRWKMTASWRTLSFTWGFYVGMPHKRNFMGELVHPGAGPALCPQPFLIHSHVALCPSKT